MWAFHHRGFKFPSRKTEGGEDNSFFHNILKLVHPTNSKILFAKDFQGCSDTGIKNSKAEALAALQTTSGDFFLTKYRTNEHTANAYCVNYSVVLHSNPDGSSN